MFWASLILTTRTAIWRVTAFWTKMLNYSSIYIFLFYHHPGPEDVDDFGPGRVVDGGSRRADEGAEEGDAEGTDRQRSAGPRGGYEAPRGLPFNRDVSPNARAFRVVLTGCLLCCADLCDWRGYFRLVMLAHQGHVRPVGGAAGVVAAAKLVLLAAGC